MRIYVNQAGYLPGSRKTVLLAEAAEQESSKKEVEHSSETVRVMDRSGRCVLEKKAEYWGYDECAGDLVWRADLTGLTVPGEYRVEYEKEQISCSLHIAEDVYAGLCRTLSKALYFQRCGIELEEPYAGKFSRKACHMEQAVRLEDYEKASQGTAAQAIRYFDVQGGWHDAGDYGRYTTTAAAALAHLLYAYQFFPEAFSESLNIPESGNGMPDILNECLYELKWLLKMQMEDGSVCHKLTSMRHANFVMPSEDHRRFILFPASSMAAADFTAVMALASRVYSRFDEAFSRVALEAAERSWNWLENHPEFTGFQNPEGCNTGEYADTDDRDERLWAAAEMYRTLQKVRYLEKAEQLFGVLEAEGKDMVSMGWGDVSGFAGWSLLEDLLKTAEPDCADSPACGEKENTDHSSEGNKDGKAAGLSRRYLEAFTAEAERILALCRDSGYGVAMVSGEYEWGSNMTVLNRAMILGTAFILTGNPCYRECAVQQMDYILGVNAAGYSYVTGAGEHAFRNPHNRVTVADGIEETIPGFVSGGPNAYPVDEKAEWLIRPGTSPMKCYLDIWECYSLNEITIYWNSPAVFAAAFLSTEKEESGPFETLESRKVKAGRFTIVQDHVRVNGHEQPYDYMEIREGVSVLPILDGHVLLQKQYRYPVRSWQWELPGGFVDPGEIPATAAVRELEEETGYQVKNLVPLGAFYPSFGSTNEKIHLFAAECGEKGETHREPGEVIRMEKVTIEEFRQLVAEGKFMHGAGLAAWARYMSSIN